MQPNQPSEPVEDITLRIGNLELQITARVVDSAGASSTSLSGFEIVRGTVQGASNRPGGPIPDLVDCPLISQNLEIFKQGTDCSCLSCRSGCPSSVAGVRECPPLLSQYFTAEHLFCDFEIYSTPGGVLDH